MPGQPPTPHVTKRSLFWDATTKTVMKNTPQIGNGPNYSGQWTNAQPSEMSNRYIVVAVRRRDNSMAETSVTSANFSGLAIQYTKPLGGSGIMRVTYGNKWDYGNDGEGAHSELFPDLPYKGYAGKTVELTAVMDDISAPPRLSGVNNFERTSTSQAIQVLSNWSQQYTGKAWKDKTLYEHLLVVKRDATAEDRQFAIDAYVDSLGSAQYNSDPEFKKTVDSLVKSNVIKVKKVRPETRTVLESTENSPLPPPPLVLRVGSMYLDPCVLLKASMTIYRYSAHAITGAEIKLTFQEVPENKTLWQAPPAKDDYYDISTTYPSARMATITTEVEVQQKYTDWDGKSQGSGPIKNELIRRRVIPGE